MNCRVFGGGFGTAVGAEMTIFWVVFRGGLTKIGVRIKKTTMFLRFS
jgi:hypothetical protein